MAYPITAKKAQTRTDYRAILSKPPRSEAEAKAQVDALIKRDRRLLDRLAKL